MFAPDYFAARRMFLSAAHHSHEALELASRGPRGEPLTIDIQWLGAPDARRLLLVTSGIHGVESFAGSAVQCAFVSAPPAIAAGCAVALVHVLNPWGFVHLRRTNERNVDLNRNFLRADEPYRGAPALYRTLDRLLNPRSPPRFDGFAPRALLHILRHGAAAVTQTIAGGQYDFERGLFFGGHELEDGPGRFIGWLKARSHALERVVAIDLHTGLGAFGRLSLFAGPHIDPPRAQQLGRALGIAIHQDLQSDTGSYATQGGLREALPDLLPQARVEALTAEFGTFSSFSLLHALREENRLHHYGEPHPGHPAKQRLLGAFRPDSARWRVAVITQGTELLRRALSLLEASG